MNYLQKINKYSSDLLNNYDNDTNYKLIKYINKYNDQSGGVNVQLTLKDHYDTIRKLLSNYLRIFIIRISKPINLTFKEKLMTKDRYHNMFFEFLLRPIDISLVLDEFSENSNVVINKILDKLKDTQIDNNIGGNINKLTTSFISFKDTKYNINYSMEHVKYLNKINNQDNKYNLILNETYSKITTTTRKYYLTSVIFIENSSNNFSIKIQTLNKDDMNNIINSHNNNNIINNSNINESTRISFNDNILDNNNIMDLIKDKKFIICNVYLSENTFNQTFLF